MLAAGLMKQVGQHMKAIKPVFEEDADIEVTEEMNKNLDKVSQQVNGFTLDMWQKKAVVAMLSKKNLFLTA
jgi:hypothetical protein